MVDVEWRWGTVSPWSNGTSRYRVPASADPAEGYDAHLHVLDPDGRTLHEVWRFNWEGPGEATGGKYAPTDLYGTGIGFQDGLNSGTRAYGGSAIGGLIRQWELDQGEINHVLAVALTNDQLRQGWVWPATTEDSGSGSYAGLIPMGSLVAIPPGVDLSSLGLSEDGMVLARALQDFGAYVVDRAGAFAFSAEPSAEDDLDQMRSDLAEIREQLRLVLNNGPGSVGGGGDRARPPAPPLAEPGETSAAQAGGEGESAEGGGSDPSESALGVTDLNSVLLVAVGLVAVAVGGLTGHRRRWLP